MKIEDVPQDKEDYKQRSQIKKVVYATDKDGNYTTVPSLGWEVEHQATMQAWEEIEEELKEISQEIKEGKLSPIYYFMRKSLMDVSLLAEHIGKWKWQVKRHLKPSGFKKLGTEVLEKYAAIFNCTVEDLTHFKPL